MSDQEVCEFLKSDMTWHKPTQSFSSPDNFFNILWKNTLNEGRDVLGNGYGKKFNTKINFLDKDREAFKIIELEAGAKWGEIQNQFKKLVKKYHPDMNAGNKKYEEKLKIITLAYTQLKLVYKGK
jgi:DnaJ-domain-containing protein 1